MSKIFVITCRIPVAESVFNFASVCDRSFTNLPAAVDFLQREHPDEDSLDLEECGDGVWALEPVRAHPCVRYVIAEIDLPQVYS